MFERVKTFVDKNKYFVMAAVFLIVFAVNFTVVKQERNGYENQLNKLQVIAETLREQAKVDPSAKTVIVQVESQITQVKNDSMWINIVYLIFLAVIATIILVLLSTFGQWGYTHIPFTRKLLNPDGIDTDADVSMYARVLSSVYIGEAIIIAACIYAVFGV